MHVKQNCQMFGDKGIEILLGAHTFAADRS